MFASIPQLPKFFDFKNDVITLETISVHYNATNLIETAAKWTFHFLQNLVHLADMQNAKHVQYLVFFCSLAP